MNMKEGPVEQECVVCVNKKQAKESYKAKLTNSSEEPIIHMDICGSMASRSHGGNWYFLTMNTV